MCSADEGHSLYDKAGSIVHAPPWGQPCRECQARLKPSLKLSVLAAYFGIDHDAHDALDDVLANVEVGKRVLEELGLWEGDG